MSKHPKPTNPDLETDACLRARMIELDLLEQALNQGQDMTAYKLRRLEDLQQRIANANTPPLQPDEGIRDILEDVADYAMNLGEPGYLITNYGQKSLQEVMTEAVSKLQAREQAARIETRIEENRGWGQMYINQPEERVWTRQDLVDAHKSQIERIRSSNKDKS